MADRLFFPSSWGSVRLWISNITTESGRDVVVKEYARGGTPDVQDRGSKTRIVTCDLLFDEMDGDELGPIERVEAMEAVIEDAAGDPRLFVHPIYGSYQAKISDFHHAITSTGVISGSAKFIPCEQVGAVSVAPTGVSLEIDADVVNVSLDDLRAQLRAAELPETSLLDSIATFSTTLEDFGGLNDLVSGAVGEFSNVRDVLVGLATINETIQSEVDDLGIIADTAMWPLFAAYVTMGEALRASSEATTGGSSSLMSVLVQQPSSLWTLLQQTYGGRGAVERRNEVLSLNDIGNPARIETGTVLLFPRP